MGSRRKPIPIEENFLNTEKGSPSKHKEPTENQMRESERKVPITDYSENTKNRK